MNILWYAGAFNRTHLENDGLVDAPPTAPYIFADGREILVDLLNDYLCLLRTVPGHEKEKVP